MSTTKPLTAAKRKKEEPLKFSEAFRQISARVGILGVLLTLLTSFSLPGAITTTLNGDFGLTEAGTSSIIHNIILTAPLTIGLTVIFLAIARDWFTEVISLYLFGIAVLVLTSVLFSNAGRSLVADAWHLSTGNVLFSFPANLVSGYFRLYFWAPFAGAILTAIFLTWALMKMAKVKKWEE